MLGCTISMAIELITIPLISVFQSAVHIFHSKFLTTCTPEDIKRALDSLTSVHIYWRSVWTVLTFVKAPSNLLLLLCHRLNHQGSTALLPVCITPRSDIVIRSSSGPAMTDWLCALCSNLFPEQLFLSSVFFLVPFPLINLWFFITICEVGNRRLIIVVCVVLTSFVRVSHDEVSSATLFPSSTFILCAQDNTPAEWERERKREKGEGRLTADPTSRNGDKVVLWIPKINRMWLIAVTVMVRAQTQEECCSGIVTSTSCHRIVSLKPYNNWLMEKKTYFFSLLFSQVKQNYEFMLKMFCR